MNLPAAFQEEMKALLKEDYASYEESFQKPRVYGLRVNQSKVLPEEFRKISPFSLRQVPWTENGFYYDSKDPVAKHPYYHAGLYYIQEPSAMVPASRLPISRGDRVLDLCAAPGGKSTELAARLDGSGILVSNDISRSRAIGLLKNLELFGAGNILVTSAAPEDLEGYFPEYFDKILTDVPCSGEGMFRRDPAMIHSWEEHGPEYYVPIQRQILKSAVSLLSPGGMLLYSTCTFDERENEDNIRWILEEYPELSLIPAKSSDGFYEGSLPGTLRLFPHKIEGEGHFAALLQKAGERFPAAVSPSKKTTVPEELEDFFNLVKIPILEDTILEIRGGKAYAVPKELPSVKGLSFLRTGLYLGDLKKNRFEPSQALAMYLKKGVFSQTVDLSCEDPNVIRYLKGETVEVPECPWDGWVLVCVDGFSLGWAKAKNGTLKNKYCTGWRMQ